MIKLSITHGEKEVQLEASETNAGHVVMALEGAYGLFGFTTHKQTPEPVHTRSVVDKVAASPLSEKQVREVTAAKQEMVVANSKESEMIQAHRPRAVELLNSQRSLYTTIADSANLSDPPEWYETGIKIKDGVPHYRTRYWCQNPQCRNQGNHYVPLDAATTECHVCGQKLLLRPAMGVVGEDGIPERDRFGNFFRADAID